MTQYSTFNMCIETHDGIALLCVPKPHIHYILKDIEPNDIESEIERIELKSSEESENC